MLTEDEIYHLTEKELSKTKKANHLAIKVLPTKGGLIRPISQLYCCLVESALTLDGLESHYYLAQTLRDSGKRGHSST